MFVGYLNNRALLPRIFKRKICLLKYNMLAIQRAFSLWGLSVGSFYSFWLLGRHGWRRYSAASHWIIKVVFVLLVCMVTLGDYASFVYSWFSSPLLSDKGYLGYTVFASCILIWLCQLGLYFFVERYRVLLGPYKERVLMCNVVVLIILISLFAQVSRAKFGIRVWFPTTRDYGSGQSSLDFWDW